MKITKVLCSICFACSLLITTSCTEQRDLYVASWPQILIENDWTPSQVSPDHGATAMLYSRTTGERVELMPDANRKTIDMDKGIYDIIVFNGLMYSPSESNLDNIYYRGTDRFETFEAVVTEMSPSQRFRAGTGEVIVNNPDILATRSTANYNNEATKKYEIKYHDGKNGYPTTTNYIEDTISHIPCRVVINCVVICRVKNVKSAKIAQAKLRGFSQSVFLSNRMPSHTSVTHQFTLNSLKFDDPDPTIGTITSQIFSTFGPPLDLPERRYTIDMSVLLINGQELPPKTFDVTDQVLPFIDYIKAERLKNNPIITIPIELFLYIELPVVVSDGMDVGVGDWGDDVIVTIPIKLD